MSPETVSQARILRLEQAGLNAMPAFRVAWNGGWIVRISAGGARRRNSVTCLDPSDAGDVEGRIARIESDYARAGLPAIFRLSPLAPPALDAALEKRGYRTMDETLVLHLELPQRGESGRFAAVPSEAWFQVAGSGLSEPAAQELHAAPPLTVPASLYPLLDHEGAPACAARLVLDGRLAGIFDVATLPAARRSGLARRIMFETLSAAAARGAREAWLQVVASNQAAVSLYSSLGFIEAYRYRYRVRR